MKLKLRIFALMAMLLCAFSVNAKVTAEAELSSALTADGEVASVTALEGEGTEASPFLINNLAELAWFRDDVNAGNNYQGKYVKLTADIDLNNEEWTPIAYNGDITFKGTFDGGNNTIKNLKITKGLTNSAENNGIGLFGKTNTPATIKNFTIENVDITGSLHVGAVVGYGYTGKLVENVTVKGDIAIDAWWYAGVIGGYGYMNTINNCHVIGNDGSYIKGNDGSYIGGIWGFRGEGANKITDCTVTNLDIQGVDRVGGISGIGHYGNSIQGCNVNNVSVTATDPEATTVGLIVGACEGTVSNPTVFTDNAVQDVTVQVGDVEVENPGLYGTDIKGNNATTNYVAKIGSVGYTSLQEAVDAAVDGKTITLIANVELTESDTIPAGATIILDLAGYKISQTKEQTAGYQMILNDGNLTIKDSSEGQTGKISYADSGNGGEYVSNTITNRGTLTVESGIIENLSSASVAKNGYPYAIDTSIWGTAAEVNTIIKGGTVTCANYSALRLFAASETKNINISIEGGTINGCIEVQNPSSNKATMGSLTISGGTINKNNSSKAIMIFGAGGTAENLKVAISGGTFTGEIGYSTNFPIANFDENVITGGTFNTDVTVFCADGFACEANEDGTYGIVEAEVELPEVEITDIKGSLKDVDPDLTFALNFAIKDLENLDEEYLNKVMEQYGSWYTDYVLTISGLTDENVTFNANGNGDGYLAGQYDAWSENWVSVPFEDVTLADGESIYIMEYAAKLMGQTGLRYTLAEIATIVQNFNCGVYFSPEFLTANPGLQVDLQLKVFTEDADGNKVNEIDVATNEFDIADYVAIVHADGKQTAYCTTLADAVAAAVDGKTITLIANVELTESVTIPAGATITLDLAGYTISQTKEQTAGYQMILNDGKLTITDSSKDQTGKISYADSGNGGEYVSNTITNRSVLVINGGTIENLSSATVASNGYPHAVDTYSGTRDIYVEINGGTIYCAEYSAIRMFCVSATNTADLVINNGTIKGAIDMQNGTKVAALGTLTINDGTFETTKNANNIRFANWNGGATEYGVSAEIKGGSFNGGITTAYVPAAANWNKGIITGGTFAQDVTEYCEFGYGSVMNSDETYSVKAGIYNLVEGVAYTNATDIADATVKYSRTLSNVGKWYALYLPVQIPVSFFLDNGYSIAEYSTMHSYDENEDDVIDRMTMEVMHITNADATLTANYPYFIRANSAEAQTLEIELTNTTLYAAASTEVETNDIDYTYTLTGTYEPVTSTEDETRYALYANGVWDIMNGTLKPFRHYLTITDSEGSNVILSTEALKAMRIVASGEEGFEGTTGVETVETPSAGNDVIYDLSGRRVEEPVKGGMYIINGKKVIY